MPLARNCWGLIRTSLPPRLREPWKLCSRKKRQLLSPLLSIPIRFHIDIMYIRWGVFLFSTFPSSLSGAREIARLPMPSFSLFLSTDNQYIMDFLLDFILHIDQYMIDIVQEYHMWAYAILFLIISAKRGWWSHLSCRAIPCFCGGSYCRTARHASRGQCAGFDIVCCRGIGRLLQLHDRAFLRAKALQ